jgi:hypothetical protein
MFVDITASPIELSVLIVVAGCKYYVQVWFAAQQTTYDIVIELHSERIKKLIEFLTVARSTAARQNILCSLLQGIFKSYLISN